MRIVMVGSGYVGLVSGTCLADFGHDVVCIDTDVTKIAALRAGRMPIYEPGLEALVGENVRRGRLGFGTDLAAAVREADAVFIAVGTPSRRGDGFADLSYVYAAAREIAAALTGYTVIVTKSTVPVGTGDEVERIIREARPDAAFAVVSNPEFLREGAAIDDFKRPDRIVIGTEDARAEAVMREVYRPLYLNAAPILVTGRRTAELTKYAANAFLATKITFINEIADLCEQVGADVQEVARGIGLDNRIGSKFLHAGPGLWRLVLSQGHAGPGQDGAGCRHADADRRDGGGGQRPAEACHGAQGDPGLRRLGAGQDDRVARPHLQAEYRRHARRAVAGASSPGCRMPVRRSAPTIPRAWTQARLLLPDIAYADDPYSCAEGADALVLVTEWNAFRALDLERLRTTMAQPILVDLRNVYRVQDVERLGFRYAAVGRAPGSRNGAQ